MADTATRRSRIQSPPSMGSGGPPLRTSARRDPRVRRRPGRPVAERLRITGSLRGAARGRDSHTGGRRGPRHRPRPCRDGARRRAGPSSDTQGSTSGPPPGGGQLICLSICKAGCLPTAIRGRAIGTEVAVRRFPAWSSRLGSQSPGQHPSCNDLIESAAGSGTGKQNEVWKREWSWRPAPPGRRAA
jgi:hypothetical protein